MSKTETDTKPSRFKGHIEVRTASRLGQMILLNGPVLGIEFADSTRSSEWFPVAEDIVNVCRERLAEEDPQ